jgi:DNA topoisomerase-1
LWKYLDKEAKSAGRVQSVVNRILIDKEQEIKDAISTSKCNTPYLKTTAEFVADVKLLSLLDENKFIINHENANSFLKLITKHTEFKVINIDNKISIRKPSTPFITSTLQQEASTKLNFNVKKTMDVAQKLYEAGLITYMRTDSPHISDDISKECADYISKTYGENYSKPTKYESKNKSSQEAHECIRPCHIEMPTLSGDQLKLYNLIYHNFIKMRIIKYLILYNIYKFNYE